MSEEVLSDIETIYFVDKQSQWFEVIMPPSYSDHIIRSAVYDDSSKDIIMSLCPKDSENEGRLLFLSTTGNPTCEITKPKPRGFGEKNDESIQVRRVGEKGFLVKILYYSSGCHLEISQFQRKNGAIEMKKVFENTNPGYQGISEFLDYDVLRSTVIVYDKTEAEVAPFQKIPIKLGGHCFIPSSFDQNEFGDGNGESVMGMVTGDCWELRSTAIYRNGQVCAVQLPENTILIPSKRNQFGRPTELKYIQRDAVTGWFKFKYVLTLTDEPWVKKSDPSKASNTTGMTSSSSPSSVQSSSSSPSGEGSNTTSKASNTTNNTNRNADNNSTGRVIGGASAVLAVAAIYHCTRNNNKKRRVVPDSNPQSPQNPKSQENWGVASSNQIEGPPLVGTNGTGGCDFNGVQLEMIDPAQSSAKPGDTSILETFV